MTAVEMAIYAAETRLLMQVVAALAAIFFAAALIFAFLYGSVGPRLRAAKVRNQRLRLENKTLRATHQRLKTDLCDGAGRIVSLEKQSATLAKEVQRLNGIRKRTDTSLLQTKALLERLQGATGHVDMP